MRVLCIANDLPVPANTGGRVDVWRRLQALQQAGHQVSLLCWTDVGRTPALTAAEEAELHRVCAAVRVEAITRSPREIAARLAWLWRWPSHVASRWVTSRSPALRDWVQAQQPELVLLDGLYGGAVALDLASRLHLPLVYRSHNIEHQYMADQRQREARWVRRLGLAANCLGLERFERSVVARATQVMDISLEDGAYWRSLGHEHIRWVPTLVDAAFAERLAQAPTDKRWDLLYFGNLNTPNNVEALTWWVEQVLPRVAGVPWRVAVAGSRPTEGVRALLARDRRITLIENPADMAAVIGMARVLVNPMRAGSGVNLKSVEMLFTDAALVSTSVGVKGLPPEAQACFAVADDPAGFAQAMQQALAASPPVDGRMTARQVFSESALLAVVQEAAARPRRGLQGVQG